jgi:ATP-dependent Lon protease
MTAEDITPQAAVLKRFRELLREQRDRFREYLTVLDKQQDAIEGGAAEALLAHVDLEEHLVQDICNIQKVIERLEALYRTLSPRDPAGDAEVSGLKASLEGLKQEAATRSQRNRDLLAERMTEIRSELKSLRGNPYARRSIYADTGTPSMIDLKG